MSLEASTLESLVDQRRFPRVAVFSHRSHFPIEALLQKILQRFYCEAGAACQGCGECRSVAEHRHPDVLWLAGEQPYKMGDVECVHTHLQDRAFGGKPRSVVLRSAELLNVSAANRLLKILEEPPPEACILLTTSKPGALLPTIRSRVVKWNLAAGESSRPEKEDSLDGTQLASDLTSLLSLGPKLNDAERLTLCERIVRAHDGSSIQLLDELECHLNARYRQLIRGSPKLTVGQALQIKRRRRKMSSARRLLASGVPMNMQLFLETIGLAR